MGGLIFGWCSSEDVDYSAFAVPAATGRSALAQAAALAQAHWKL